MRVIHGDVILNFGKHKNRAVSDVLAEEPSYFYWLVVNGMATLTTDVKGVVAEWVNSVDGKKRVGSIDRMAKENNRFKPWVAASEVDVADDVIAAPAVTEIDRGDDWGSW